jgi:RimJ/RimL family protein N-acetyltransferase
MSTAANYTADERLRDGRRVEIRALRPDDKADMLDAVSHIGAHSMRRRFFGAKRSFSEAEQAFYLNVDFVNHVALIAVVDDGKHPTIVGGGRYVVVQPGSAEVAFAVVDAFQGQGIGSTLLCHLIVIARDAGLKELIAEVLPENAAMLKVFEKSGLKVATQRAAGAVHIRMQIS